MLLGILLIVLVLYGLLLFWVLNERLREIHHLVRSSMKRVERIEERVGELAGLRNERREEEKGVEEDHFSFHALEDETTRKKGEKK